jgi:membrane-bound serine protease (ClpP class)
MTVRRSLKDSKATEAGIDELLGKEGVALSDLRPAGFAQLDGRRVDVVTRGDMIAKGQPVCVVEVESNRVVVKKMQQKET